MKSRISEILKEMKNKRLELLKEYEVLKEKYQFIFEKNKIIFSKIMQKVHKKKKRKIFRFGWKSQLKDFIFCIFIYGMIIPTLILDIFLIVYQNIYFRAYGIPLVKRKDHIAYDRQYLDYLNWVEKFHCIYCSYVNGVYSYAVEIAGRTEQYWCPIKRARRLKYSHNWEKSFADYGDAEGFHECFKKTDAFQKKD